MGQWHAVGTLAFFVLRLLDDTLWDLSLWEVRWDMGQEVLHNRHTELPHLLMKSTGTHLFLRLCHLLSSYLACS